MYRRLMLLAAAVLVAGVSALDMDRAYAGDIFVYKRADGSRLITDHRRIEPGYRLVKIYADTSSSRSIARPARRLGTAKSAYDGVIIRTATQLNMDPSLVKAVVHAESAFDRYAVSRKGASGLMQLMPATAKRYGVSSLFDPQQNVAGGTRYLRDLLTMFDGDTRLALAGYNAGENAVQRFGGVPPYAETQAFVVKVMELHRRYLGLDCDQGGVRNCPGAGVVADSG